MYEEGKMGYGIWAHRWRLASNEETRIGPEGIQRYVRYVNNYSLKTSPSR